MMADAGQGQQPALFLLTEDEVFRPSAALARGEVRPDPPLPSGAASSALAQGAGPWAGASPSTATLPPEHGLNVPTVLPRTGNSTISTTNSQPEPDPRLPRFQQEELIDLRRQRGLPRLHRLQR